jgi:hypothetical protein
LCGRYATGESCEDGCKQLLQDGTLTTITPPHEGFGIFGRYTRWMIIVGATVVVALLMIFVLPGRVCVCLTNVDTEPLDATVRVPGSEMKFDGLASGATQCRPAKNQPRWGLEAEGSGGVSALG